LLLLVADWKFGSVRLVVRLVTRIKVLLRTRHAGGPYGALLLFPGTDVALWV
jgi:hypothetical protein